ncbi:hypothetical protein NC653_008314 [Populus alba x Populus x berolinensis]|uniref:Uncharacterized protein n=1 Tax=Populus alba x Populus x berolinensis TaxID=444605 RepID=A0AAD6R771_9ROSI|nr:hypothetical protein NC653_008314 [Populus alba x Populus x berolinensis]
MFLAGNWSRWNSVHQNNSNRCVDPLLKVALGIKDGELKAILEKKSLYLKLKEGEKRKLRNNNLIAGFLYLWVQIANVEYKFAIAISDCGEIKVEGKVKDRKPHLTKAGSFGVDVSMVSPHTLQSG